MTLAAYLSRPRGALLTLHNAKTPKGEGQGYLTAIMYLAPHDLSGFNVCAMSTPACRADCLYSAGRGRFPATREARLKRAALFFSDRRGFMRQLRYEIEELRAVAALNRVRLAVRLNGTSDIPWARIPCDDAPNIMALFPDVAFYDYTKRRPWMTREAGSLAASNYHLTFSVQRSTLDEGKQALACGFSVAAVAALGTHATMTQSRCVDGDAHDLRFLDAPRSLVLLTPKGTLRRDPESDMILKLDDLTALLNVRKRGGVAL